MDFRKIFIDKYGEDKWDFFHKQARTIQDNIKYHFTNTEFLWKALSVRGCSLPVEDFERLEFLGDSVINTVIAKILFDKCPNFDPNKLTRIRSAITDNKNLSRLSKQIGIDEIGKPLEIGELNTKQSADLFEAFVCAIFLDSGCDFSLVEKLLLVIIDVDEVIREIMERPWGEIDPKAYLNQYLQANRPGLSIDYKRVEPQGTLNSPIFTYEVLIIDKDGTVVNSQIGKEGKKKKEGEKRAVEELLKRWKEEGRLYE